MAPGLLVRPRRSIILSQAHHFSRNYSPVKKTIHTNHSFGETNIGNSSSPADFESTITSTHSGSNDDVKDNFVSQLIYTICYIIIVLCRWFTVIAAICFPFLVYTVWSPDRPLQTWQYYIALFLGAELVASIVIVGPHIYYQKRFFDQPNRCPPLSSNARWLLVKQTLHAYHPFPQKAFIPNERPRLSAAGHPVHSVRHITSVLSTWFFGADPSEIWIDNVKELFAWAFFHQQVYEMSSELKSELDGIVRYMQTKTGILLKRGYNPDIKCMRIFLDKKRYTWRSSLNYVIVTVIRICLKISFYLLGYTFEQSADRSVGIYIPYQYRHSRSKVSPIFLYHGLAGAIYLYIPWMIYMYLKTKRPIIVISIPGVSTCLFPARPTTPDSFNSFIQQVWTKYSIPKATLVGHSIGTGFAAWCIKNPTTVRTVIANTVLVEPICFGLCFPDLVYNFVYKTPPNWYQLCIRYFACREFNVACYLYRHFWWFQHALFKSDWGVLNLDPGMVRGGHLTHPSNFTQTIGPVHMYSPHSLMKTVDQHQKSLPISGTNPADRLAVFFPEYDYAVNVKLVCEYLNGEGFHSYSVWAGRDHGVALYSPSAWADVCQAVQTLSARTAF